MKAADVFTLLGEIPPALAPLYRDHLTAKMESVGIDPQQSQYYMLAVAHDYAPQPIASATFEARNPYANPANFTAPIEALVENRWLAPAGDNSYILTDAGRAALDAVQAELVAQLARLEPLPAADLQRIKVLLGRLVDAALAAPEPAEKPMLKANRRSDPGEAGPLLLNLLQYLADLNTFRDETHISAWRTHGVSGQAWEALTLVWRDEAHSAAELAEKLSHRTYDADGYVAALAELAARGWVEQADGRVRLSEAGAAVRQQVEDRTNSLYYAPWMALSADEIAELGALLTLLRDALQALNAAQQPETAEA